MNKTEFVSYVDSIKNTIQSFDDVSTTLAELSDGEVFNFGGTVIDLLIKLLAEGVQKTDDNALDVLFWFICEQGNNRVTFDGKTISDAGELYNFLMEA